MFSMSWICAKGKAASRTLCGIQPWRWEWEERREEMKTHLVITVHQPSKLTHGRLWGWFDYLTPRAVVSPDNLPLGRSILVLHTLTAHSEGLAVVTLLGDVHEVSGGHQSSATIAGNLPREWGMEIVTKLFSPDTRWRSLCWWSSGSWPRSAWRSTRRPCRCWRWPLSGAWPASQSWPCSGKSYDQQNSYDSPPDRPEWFEVRLDRSNCPLTVSLLFFSSFHPSEDLAISRASCKASVAILTYSESWK